MWEIACVDGLDATGSWTVSFEGLRNRGRNANVGTAGAIL